jgi:hypothetical protein
MGNFLYVYARAETWSQSLLFSNTLLFCSPILLTHPILLCSPTLFTYQGLSCSHIRLSSILLSYSPLLPCSLILFSILLTYPAHWFTYWALPPAQLSGLSQPVARSPDQVYEQRTDAGNSLCCSVLLTFKRNVGVLKGQ